MLLPRFLHSPKYRSLLLLLLSLLTAGAFVAYSRTSDRRTAPAPQAGREAQQDITAQALPALAPYTLVQQRTFTPAGGRSFTRAVIERRQRADGTFALRYTYYRADGTLETEGWGYGEVGAGSYRFDETKGVLELVAVSDEEPQPATEELLRADPGYVREEAVAGRPTLVSRYPREQAAKRYREVYRAPSLQGFPLKTVTVSQTGLEINEPTRLEMGEPDSELFRRAEGYPRSYALYEENIARVERRGETELAALMRQRLARAKRR